MKQYTTDVLLLKLRSRNARAAALGPLNKDRRLHERCIEEIERLDLAVKILARGKK